MLAAAVGMGASVYGATPTPIQFDGTSAYTQDFNTLPTSGSATLGGTSPFNVPSTAGATSPLLGWQFAVPSGTSNQFRADNGGASSGAVYSYGASGNTERALGSLGNTTFNSITFGAIFTNTSEQTFTSFTLSYTGEQWRRGNESGEALAFSYGLGASSIASGSFTAATELDFSSPNTSTGIRNLNGNDPANQKAISATISGISWAPGTTLVIRWRDAYGQSADDGLAIDGLSFSAAAAQTTKNLVWSPVTTDWNSSSVNWLDGAGSSTFNSGDLVTFADAGVGMVNIDPAGVSPGGVTVSNSSGTYTFTGGPIKGPGGLTKTGSGTLILSSFNSYTGITTLSDGTLVIGGANVIPDTASLRVQGGILDLGSNIEAVGTVTISGGMIIGSGMLAGSAYTISGGTINASLGGTFSNLTKVGPGTVILGAKNTFGGLTTVADGVLKLAGGADTLNPVTAVSIGAAQLDLNGNDQRLAGLSGQGAITNSAAPIATLTIASEDDQVYDGSLGVGLRLVKEGAGTLTLNGPSSHDGGTFINGGSLWVNNTTGSGTGSGPVMVAAGTRIGGDGNIGGLLRVDGTVVPGDDGSADTLRAASLELHSGAHLQFDLDADSASSDLLAVSGAVSLPLAAGSVFLDINNLGSLQAGSYTLISHGGPLSGLLASLNVGNAPGNFGYAFADSGSALNLVVSPLASGKVWAGGLSGLWDTTSPNWTGGSGVFVNGDAVAFNDQAQGSTTITVLGTVSPGSMTFNNSQLDYIIQGGVIAGTGGLSKDGAGMVTLLGTNTFSGDVSVNRGTLAVASFASLGTASTPISVGSAASAATLRFIGQDTTTTRGLNIGDAGASIDVAIPGITATINGPVTGMGHLSKTGPGMLVLGSETPAAPLVGGTWEVDAGMLQIRPGGGGVVVLSGLNIQNAGQFDLSDNDLIVQYSGPSPQGQIQAYVRNWFSIGSGPMLMASRFNDASSPFVRTLAVSDNASIKFASFDGQNFPAGNFNQVLVKYTYLGDANLDGMVTPRDYAIVDGNVGLGHDWGTGDLSGDGKVSPLDYAQIDGNIGAGNGGSGGPQLLAVAAVPEPQLALLFAVAIPLFGRRRSDRFASDDDWAE